MVRVDKGAYPAFLSMLEWGFRMVPVDKGAYPAFLSRLERDFRMVPADKGAYPAFLSMLEGISEWFGWTKVPIQHSLAC